MVNRMETKLWEREYSLYGRIWMTTQSDRAQTLRNWDLTTGALKHKQPSKV
jgi:hypothetical protein